MAAKKRNAARKPPSKDQHNDSEFTVFYKEFEEESDRAAVVLGAARLDVGLEHLLKTMLLPCPSKEDSMFESEGALATFSSKIDMSYRLGLIGADVSHALHMVRKIRNAFAHDIQGCALTSGAHASRVRELATPLHRWNDYDFLHNFLKSKHQGPSRDFRMAVALLVIRLQGATESVKTVTTEQTLSYIPPVPMVPEPPRLPPPEGSERSS